MSGEIALQGTIQWLQDRVGKATASRVPEIVATVKSGGYGASRESLKAELLVERFTGAPTEKFVSDAMRDGTKLEPEARSTYSFNYDCDVTLVGFVSHPTIPMSGASPDGLIGDDGLLEIKCPQQPAHMAYILSDKIPQKYITQMNWQLACTGRQWCDFASYNPTFPVQMRLRVSRVHRDQKAINVLEHEVRLFLKDLDEEERLLRNKFLKDEL